MSDHVVAIARMLSGEQCELRYGVRGMSEAPEILPMKPLGGFVRVVGRAIEERELTIYLQRLQEQGWDVRNTVRKALSCGAQLQDQVRTRTLKQSL